MGLECWNMGIGASCQNRHKTIVEQSCCFTQQFISAIPVVGFISATTTFRLISMVAVPSPGVSQDHRACWHCVSVMRMYLQGCSAMAVARFQLWVSGTKARYCPTTTFVAPATRMISALLEEALSRGSRPKVPHHSCSLVLFPCVERVLSQHSLCHTPRTDRNTVFLPITL